MLDRIRNLAQFMRDKKASGEKLVLMLGAGASIASGVKPTETIMEELVEKNAKGTQGSLDDRFNQLWRGSTDAHRGRLLEPYLNQRPSSGYQKLAELMRLDFFDVVITFNFDRLLEQALDDAGFRDYRTLIRGETEPEAIAKLLAAPKPRVKILKMHGSVQSADLFLFAREEMLNYPPDLERLVDDLTSRDIIICGYAFSDNCVIRAFNPSKNSGAIYYVNPSGAVPGIKGFLTARRSQDKVIAGDLFGRFDEFFAALHQELTAEVQEAPPRPRRNLFKFLDHYQEDQKSWFLGRKSLTRRIVKRFESNPPPVLYLTGKPKVGKTSLIRAGLIPYLDANRYECIYLRCRKDLDVQLRTVLAERFSQPLPADLDWPAVFTQIAALADKRVVLFFDQFERPCRAAAEAPDKMQGLVDLIGAIAAGASGRLTAVFTAPADELAFWKLAYQAPRFDDQEIKIGPLPPARVGSIIRHAARKGGLTLDPGIVSKLSAEYQESLERPGDRQPFTLLHVQTICYYLARGLQPAYRGYQDLPQGGLLAALDSIKEETSLIDVLDDLPAPERRLIRSFLKVVCDPTSNTAKFISLMRQHFPEITEERFPEPIV
jgi:NAD-dependent SIR2 family protein deacetylase